MLIHETINAKDVQMSDAVQYCQDNNCRGYAALQTGRFPLIKDPRTVNKRLDGYSKGHQDHLRILTEDEENSLVKHIKNKNRCMQGLIKKQTTNLIKY